MKKSFLSVSIFALSTCFALLISCNEKKADTASGSEKATDDIEIGRAHV